MADFCLFLDKLGFIFRNISTEAFGGGRNYPRCSMFTIIIKAIKNSS